MDRSREELRKNSKGVLTSTASNEQGCKLVRHNDTVQKCGTKVREEEGNGLLFAHKLNLPVPKVHSISTTEGICSIHMECVDGECLEDAWDKMSVAQRKDIGQQLRSIITTMRAAQNTSRNPIGSCQGPVHDLRWIRDFTGGPFSLEQEFNEFILNLANGTPQVIRETLEESFRMRVGNRIVFTHADLSPRNIIVRDGRICALLDWEYSGWYPEYWEYIKFFDRPTGCKGWYDLAMEIFETRYPSELLSHQAAIRWQRP